MKNIKRILLIFMFALIVSNVSKAQQEPPSPPPHPSSNTRDKHTESSNTPIGTATALLLGLAGGGVVYKIRKNTITKTKC
ncbi:MAG: hypothetical protein Q4Q06_07355 [Bacteroidota bacterium]|nr:hypothetical protein [Bacteroidota bacterium]